MIARHHHHIFSFVIFILVGILKVTFAGAPSVSGFPTSISLIESQTASTNDADSLYTLSVTDPDGDTFSCALDGTSPTTDAFTVLESSGNYKVFLAKNPPFEYDNQQQYIITMSCTDSTGNSTTVQLTVNMLPNTPPAMSTFPGTADINEGETANRKLYDVTVTDSDTFTCVLTTTGTPFTLQKNTGYEVWFENLTPLDASTTPSYVLNISCSDDWGSSYGLLTVTVHANLPPSFDISTAAVNVKESDAGGSSIQTVTVTDPESDTFSCQLGTISPATSIFSLTNTGSQYDVVLSVSHSLDVDTTPSFTIPIECSDRAMSTSTSMLTVTVTPNSPPVMSVFPGTAEVNEAETAHRKLYDVTVNDPESDTVTCTLVTSGTPFALQKNTRYEVWFENLVALDASTTPSYNLVISCSDNWGSSQGTLQVTVRANSPPAFSGLPTSIDIMESHAGGSIYQVTVSDGESDTFSCGLGTISPATTIFSLPKTGSQYNVDLTTNHNLESDTTPTFIIDIECSDRTSSTSTGTLTVNILSNTPPSISGLSPPITVMQGEAGDRILKDLTVTDTDAYTCTMTSSPASSDFELRYTTGYKVYLNANPTLASPPYTLSVTCSDDYGSTTESVTVFVSPTNSPVIGNLPFSTSIVDTDLTFTSLHNLTVTDADGETVTCVISSNPTGPFILIQDTSVPAYRIYRTADAVSEPAYTITATCNDTAGGSVSGVLTVTVTANNPPTISALPDITEVLECQKTEKNIWNFTVSDTENNAFICNLTSNPAGPFDLRKDSTSGIYGAYVSSTPNFNYATVSSYSLTFECTDSGGKSSSNVLTVNVIENRFPKFSKLPDTHAVDAIATVKGTTIYSVTATDDDLDTITYSMTVSPSTSSFNISSVTGVITASEDLKFEQISNYIFTISASDSKKITNSTLDLTLNNLNTLPIISNLVLNQEETIYKSESLAAASALFTISPYDPDAGQTQTVSMDVSPSGLTNKFDFTGNVLSLAAGETFNYEDVSSYLFTFSITDTIAETRPYYLRVIVTDEPEPCVFPYRTYKAEGFEANKDGGSMNPGYGVTDEDNPDTVTYTLLQTTYRNLYQIDSATGEISFAVDYNIDANVHPQNVTLIVKCEDTRGETGTATVSLYIKDVNDNTPEFPQTGYVYYINQYTQPGAWIGTLSATDIDFGENADVEYYGSSATGSAYFTVNTNGRVHVTTDNHLTWDYGAHHRFNIKAIDQGSPRLTGTTVLDIIYINVTTTTSTTTTTTIAPSSGDWWSDPGHIALVVFASLLALALLALLLYLLLKYCRKPPYCSNLPSLSCKNCCKPSPPKPKPAKVPPKPKPGPEPFKFWDENDNNKVREVFDTQRNEKSIPETMVYK